MRVVIAYDGSDGSQAVLEDLKRAGLGEDAEAIIVSVAEVWIPAPETALEIEQRFPTYTHPKLGARMRLRRKPSRQCVQWPMMRRHVYGLFSLPGKSVPKCLGDRHGGK